jgi:ATP-dependent helicase HrpB
MGSQNHHQYSLIYLGTTMTFATLPINALRNEITEAINSDKRLIIRAPTGSGKSTQVPQILLDYKTAKGKILIMQPRRLAARMLAARVAQERSTVLGQEIGFQTRFESAISENTRASFITEGILTRMLLNDPEIRAVSTIIFDEFHERSLTSDVGLSLAVDLQRTRRPDLHIIVMSATVDIEPLQQFLSSAKIIRSEGRLFPIDIRYSPTLPSVQVWDHAAKAVASLISEGNEGDILIFMPGVYEIRRTIESIDSTVRGEQLSVFPLYGDLPAGRQNQVMDPTGRRKIIVATNIAETSLTIPGVRHVIDAGLGRISRFDTARGFNTLFTESISRDSADQRAGRAGREAPGICIRLWSTSKQAGLPMHTTPEVLRVDLAETVLSIRQIGYNSIEHFPWFESPTQAAIEQANDTLVLLGAIDPTGALTPLADQMSRFPMHPRLARLILEAGKHNCVHLATFSAALLSERSALAGKPDYPEETYHQQIASDFFGQYCLLKKINASGFDPSLCSRYAVNASAAKNILRTQTLFLEHCRRSGINTHDDENAPTELSRCILLAYPDHLAVRKDKGTLLCGLRGGRRGVLNDKSIARSARVVVATDIRELKDDRQVIKTSLSLATEIKEEWLLDHFESQWRVESTCEWNATTMAVEDRKRTWCLGVVIYESAENETTNRASTLLAETIIAKNLPLPLWDESVEDWIKKVQWVAKQFPDQNLPAFTDEERHLVIHELCEGEHRFSKVSAKPVLPYVQSLLDPQQNNFVESMAPNSIALPTGRKLRILYDPAGEPRARARIQELFGMQTTPRVAGGRVSVLIEVLAPNNRPVQITHDLANFWTAHYPELKKSLSRRYPRHEWR